MQGDYPERPGGECPLPHEGDQGSPVFGGVKVGSMRRSKCSEAPIIATYRNGALNAHIFGSPADVRFDPKPWHSMYTSRRPT